MREDIRLYCGLSETSWSGVPVAPGTHVCISPISGRSQRTKRETCVSVPAASAIIQDSGAFSDSWSQRLTFLQALDRQIKHADKYDYTNQVKHRATYDLLIDEVWHDGNRTKRRWSVSDAESAVDTTVDAARWLNNHRDGLSLVVSAQGVDANQYLRCVQRLLPFFCDGDLLGFGGWCIIGKMSRQMMPVFRETIDLVLPFIAKEGIQTIHIWGVIYPPALAYLLSVAHLLSIKISTDSAGVSLAPVMGQWGYGSWRDNDYQRPSGQQLGLDRVRHAAMTRQWLDVFGDTIDFTKSHFTGRESVTDSRLISGVTFCHDGVQAAKCDGLQSVTLPQCVVCGRGLVRRSHAKTCGTRCRKALSRSNSHTLG